LYLIRSPARAMDIHLMLEKAGELKTSFWL
jgi:hypothetical protein